MTNLPYYPLVGLLLFVALEVQAQTALPLINRTFCADTVGTITPAVQVLSDGYLLFGNYTDLYANEHIYMRKLDFNGYSQWLRVIDDEWDDNQNIDAELGIIIRGTQVITTNDNHIVLSYPKKNGATNWINDVFLVKLTLNGDTVWSRHYGDLDRAEICRHLIQTNDGGFMLVGTQGALNEEPGASFYVIKTDSEGIMEWDTTYVSNWGQAFSVQQTPWDNGYIIGGVSFSDTSLYDMCVVKITANGGLEWQRSFDGYHISDCAAQVRILTTLEEYQNNIPIRYIMFGCENDPDKNHAYINVLGANGDVVWERRNYDELLPNFGTFITYPIIRSDKSFVSATSVREVHDNRFVDFAANGDINFSQLITIDTSTSPPGLALYFQDIQATPDGGYVFAGYQFAPNPQKSWIVKTDSLGQTVPVEDCESVNTAIDTPQADVNIAWSLAPNPATDHATIYLSQPLAGQRVALYNMSGALVKAFALPDFVGQYRFSVADLPNGIYYCRLQHKDKVYSVQKLAIF